MKAYKVELLIIDHVGLGADVIKQEIKNANFPNDCIHPRVMFIQGRDIGEWSDDHPLNKLSLQDSEYRYIFDRPPK